MTERPKRLAPTRETLRRLFLYSGNLCAFPNCAHVMMNEMGDFVGQLCHIEAAEEGGQRFNAEMTNEERRGFDNLMLMCYDHHVETNNFDKYPVPRMAEMKREHERRFSSPARAILERLTDWTTLDEPTRATNLQRLNEALELKLAEEDLSEMVEELDDYVARLERVPIEVRRFVAALAQRMNRMDGSFPVVFGALGANILVSDVKLAFGLGDRIIRDKLAQLEAYDLGGFEQMDSNVGMQPAIRIRALRSGWHLWADIVTFCEKTNTPIERFADDLDFSPFDA